MDTKVSHLISKMGFEHSTGKNTTIGGQLKKEWNAIHFDAHIGIYHITIQSKDTLNIVVKTLSRIERYIAIVTRDNDLMVLVKTKKTSSKKKVKLEDVIHKIKLDHKTYDNLSRILSKHAKFTSNVLQANASLQLILRELDTINEDFINRGLLSTHFLKTNMITMMKKRKRNVILEGENFFPHLSTKYEDVEKTLVNLGHQIKNIDTDTINVDGMSVISVDYPNLDQRHKDRTPTFEAVAMLEKSEWVVLTNGKTWRMYSQHASSVSTDYLEIDLDGIADKSDSRLKYFVAIFGAFSLKKKDGITDLMSLMNGGKDYAVEIQNDIKEKIFNEGLFLNLVKAVLDFDPTIKYTHAELTNAKALSLKLLYRLLFILYAESRDLLPVDDAGYQSMGLRTIRDAISTYEKTGESTTCWTRLKKLFHAISVGDSKSNLPQYNGNLFANSDLDLLDRVKNKHLVPAILGLTEMKGKGIDYSNLQVRHLGTIYEGLLEYMVVQATTKMVIYKEQILDAKYTENMKEKPKGFVGNGEIYLTIGGFARKSSGSYFTPPPLVKFLVRQGLKDVLEKREQQFDEMIKNSKNVKLLEDILLDLQIIDPSMGSGHFLVDAVDQITRWAMNVIRRHPNAPINKEIDKIIKDVISENKKKKIIINPDLLTANSILKRMIMKRCIYGVDLNPLSVDLAKLSLWLDSFTIGMPLTYLDHHIKCGNSLIGVPPRQLNKTMVNKQNTLTSELTVQSMLKDFTLVSKKDVKNITRAGNMMQKVNSSTDSTITMFTSSQETHKTIEETMMDSKHVHDLKIAHIINEEIHDDMKYDLDSTSTQKASNLAYMHNFFHWDLEFPDAFSDKRWGFDLVIGNPPWDKLKPKDSEFFLQHDPNFGSSKNKIKTNKQKNKLLENTSIKNMYVQYVDHIKNQSKYFKSEYKLQDKGDIDLWLLFTERIFDLCTENGMVSVLLPSGIIGSQGARKLRGKILDNKIISLYEFENRMKIFDIHSSYKFVLLTMQNSNPTPEFPAAFYLHDANSLDKHIEQEKFLSMPVKFIKNANPENMTIFELRHKNDAEILKQIYSHNKISDGFDDGTKINFVREFDRTNDANLFTTNGKGWPVIEGKNIHQFQYLFTKADLSISKMNLSEKITKKSLYGNMGTKFINSYRLIYRMVASSTNLRTMISCIIPPSNATAHSTSIILLTKNNKPIIDYGKILYLAGIFNSFVFDYIIRFMVDVNLSSFIIKQAPIPCSIFINDITKQACRLSLSEKIFHELAIQLKFKIKHISTPADRIDTLAKLDALVAHAYGLTREQYKHIISTFKFGEDPDMYTAKEIILNNKTLKNLYGEVRKRVLKQYDYISLELSQEIKK
ncbi:MAG: N6 adenine-specific DNA methyltransferase [Cenarchaeum symbiont of Oopsacas minuta]|nr:N6 adenine-specific DNA methyltransferase [Cenarchaeum symbiont of Oopsacas minuta]